MLTGLAQINRDSVDAITSKLPLVLGKNGVEERKDIGTLSAFEQKALNEMLDVLHKDIELGEKFINN